MDFHALPRRDLQALCKRNGVRANMTNSAMADALRALAVSHSLRTPAELSDTRPDEGREAKRRRQEDDRGRQQQGGSTDFLALPRRDLQALCKRNGVRANMTNAAMADALRALPKVDGIEEYVKQPVPEHEPEVEAVVDEQNIQRKPMMKAAAAATAAAEKAPGRVAVTSTLLQQELQDEPQEAVGAPDVAVEAVPIWATCHRKPTMKAAAAAADEKAPTRATRMGVVMRTLLQQELQEGPQEAVDAPVYYQRCDAFEELADASTPQKEELNEVGALKQDEDQDSVIIEDEKLMEETPPEEPSVTYQECRAKSEMQEQQVDDEKCHAPLATQEESLILGLVSAVTEEASEDDEGANFQDGGGSSSGLMEKCVCEENYGACEEMELVPSVPALQAPLTANESDANHESEIGNFYEVLNVTEEISEVDIKHGEVCKEKEHTYEVTFPDCSGNISQIAGEETNEEVNTEVDLGCQEEGDVVVDKVLQRSVDNTIHLNCSSDISCVVVEKVGIFTSEMPENQAAFDEDVEETTFYVNICDADKPNEVVLGDSMNQATVTDEVVQQENGVIITDEMPQGTACMQDEMEDDKFETVFFQANQVVTVGNLPEHFTMNEEIVDDHLKTDVAHTDERKEAVPTEVPEFIGTDGEIEKCHAPLATQEDEDQDVVVIEDKKLMEEAPAQEPSVTDQECMDHSEMQEQQVEDKKCHAFLATQEEEDQDLVIIEDEKLMEETPAGEPSVTYQECRDKSEMQEQQVDDEKCHAPLATQEESPILGLVSTVTKEASEDDEGANFQDGGGSSSGLMEKGVCEENYDACEEMELVPSVPALQAPLTANESDASHESEIGNFNEVLNVTEEISEVDIKDGDVCKEKEHTDKVAFPDCSGNISQVAREETNEEVNSGVDLGCQEEGDVVADNVLQGSVDNTIHLNCSSDISCVEVEKVGNITSEMPENQAAFDEDGEETTFYVNICDAHKPNEVVLSDSTNQADQATVTDEVVQEENGVIITDEMSQGTACMHDEMEDDKFESVFFQANQVVNVANLLEHFIMNEEIMDDHLKTDVSHTGERKEVVPTELPEFIGTDGEIEKTPLIVDEKKQSTVTMDGDVVFDHFRTDTAHADEQKEVTGIVTEVPDDVTVTDDEVVEEKALVITEDIPNQGTVPSITHTIDGRVKENHFGTDFGHGNKQKKAITADIEPEVSSTQDVLDDVTEFLSKSIITMEPSVCKNSSEKNLAERMAVLEEKGLKVASESKDLTKLSLGQLRAKLREKLNAKKNKEAKKRVALARVDENVCRSHAKGQQQNLNLKQH